MAATSTRVDENTAETTANPSEEVTTPADEPMDSATDAAVDAADAVPAPVPHGAAQQEPNAEQGGVEAPSTVVGRSAREVTGVVTSNKPDKTIIVRVDRRIKHPVYGKFIRRRTKIAAHDEANACREGDTVTIVETRPVSKTKSWALGRILGRADV